MGRSRPGASIGASVNDDAVPFVAMGGDGRLLVEVLGPIHVRHGDGHDVTPEGGLQRRLLALLVLFRGRVVSADTAIEALWPSQPPRDSAGALQTHMSRLRRSLSPGVIESIGDGYRIVPAQLDVDADRLADAVGGALDAAAPSALSTIDELLDRWQGPAYPELADVDVGRAEASRLAELRVHAAEVRAERRLATGQTDGLVAELAALAEEAPLRERPRELLMSALAAVGRQAEALRAYDDFRRLLGEELGIEPSPALSAKHAELLRGIDVASWRPASRIPVPITSLEGREATLEEIIDLAEDRRLVTLLGPGGVGKTRLLIELGHRLRTTRPDRAVVMCELAASTGDSAVDVVASAVAIDRRADVGLSDRLAALLGDTEVVLLFDNCEHVLDPIADLVERLLVSCPQLSVVATSRERLRVPGEQLYTVTALPTIAEDGPAVRLFVDRARAVTPGFKPAPAERASIVEIVRRLDGLPLAIELAAARLHTLDVDEVAAGLDRRFELLSSGTRTSSRHGSLAATVAWSYDLLGAEQRQTFADLSVFAGAFTAADAAAICGMDVHRAAAALDQFVERSLVTRVPRRRFALLETLRAFGAEQLAAEGRADPTGGRHARYYVDWAEEPERRQLDSVDAIVDIDAALPELRVALDWLLDHMEVDLAGRLIVALTNYGVYRLRPDVLAWARRASAGPAAESPLTPLLWAADAYALWMAGDVAAAGLRIVEAVQLSEDLGGPIPSMVALMRGNLELFEGRLAEAGTWYRRASLAAAGDPIQLRFAEATEILALGYAGDPETADRAAALLAAVGDRCTPVAAYAWYCAGEADLGIDVERARVRLARAVELGELTGTSFVVGLAGTSKASIEARLGDPLVAAEEYRRLIDHWRRAGMWSTQWTMLRSIAGLLARLGRTREAAVLSGSVQATRAGHRIFGEDEVALAELGRQLRDALGEEVYDAAFAEGAVLDGDFAVEHALRSLRG